MTASLEKLMANGDVNPLKSDAELAMMLKKLDKVNKYKTFQKWKTKFLERLEQYLYESGIAPADKAGLDFDRTLNKFVKGAGKVTDHITKGELGDEKKTVKASLSLNEMCKQLTDVIETLKTLIPSTSKEEKQKGFTKFHLGAALIRQGFHQYISMNACQDAVHAFSEKLEHVADKQQLELFKYYETWVERFCAVMADLGLYSVMMKCLEFANAPEEEESSDEEDIHIEIEVSTPEGLKRLKLELDPRETIGNIKEAIAEDIGIEAPKQIMSFKGKEIDDNDTSLKKCGVVNGSKLIVEPFTIPITVNTYDGQSIPLQIDPDTYMSDIKRMVEKHSGIPARNQKLFHKDEELDDDFKQASEYNIEAGAVLDMEPKSIKVTVEMPDGEQVELDLSPHDTDEEIKAKIEEKTGMGAPRQVLNTNGEKMPRGIKVKDLGMKDGSNIQVEVFKIPVTVNTYDGKTFQTMVDPSIYMSDLKRQLEPQSGVAANNQKISMNGSELSEDTNRAEDYGIQDGSILDLEPKLIKVQVEMPEAPGKRWMRATDNEIVEVEISPSASPKELKEKIAEKKGLEPTKQVLKFQDQEMPDNEALKDIGVRDGSKIKVEIFKVPVTVETYDGKTFETMVDPTMYMSDLKRQLEDDSGIPAINQKLFKDGSELDEDTKKAEDYEIKGGDTLYVEPKKMSVTVDMPDGNRTEVEITPNDTADEIKEKIEARTGMEAPRQVLKKDGKQLPNGQPARAMGIKDGDNLSVDISTIPITVNTMDGKQIKLDVDPTDKLSDIKKQLEEEAGIPWENQELFKDGSALVNDDQPIGEQGVEANDVLDLEPKSMQITVDMPDGSRANIAVKPSDTSADIKQKIEAKTGMAVPRQVLKKDGSELPEGTTVKDMGVRDGDNLSVDVFTVPVTVNTMDGQVIKIDVDPTDKLGDMKKQLESESGIPWNNQQLFKDGSVLADDDKTAQDHGIQGGDELYLEPKKMSVTVDMPDGSRAEIEITPSDTSADIKQKVEAKTGMSVPRQVLKKDGSELPEGTTVKDMGVRDGDNLSVDVFTVPVTVNTMDGQVIKIDVDPTDKLGDMKKQLESESGIPWNNQQLFKDGSVLADDDKTAQDHGIQGGDELYLEPKKMSVTVDMPDGSRAEIEITPSDTSADIKQKVEAKTGMSVPRQVLKKDGSELPEGTTVKDMGVRDGDNLSVDVFTVPVTVNTMDGQVIKIDVDPTDKLGDMKKQLESESGIPWNNQQLFKDGSVLADDDKTAQDHGIQGGDELYLEPKKMSVTVDMPDGSRAEIEITPSDTSADIKQKVEAKTGMAVPRQVLKKDGSELPEGTTVKDMGVRDGDNLSVDVFTVPVTVNTMDGQVIKIDVDPTDKLGDMKKQLESESGIPWNNQQLFKDGSVLADDDKTAQDHGIQGGDELYLEPKKMSVTVDMPDGSRAEIEITPSDTSADIKQKVEAKTGMAVPRQVLKKDGSELPEGTTVKDMGVRDGDNLSVDVFTVPVTVNTMDGQVIKIDVDPTDKLGDMKKQLESESGIPWNNQQLFKDGSVLADDDKTAQDHGIQGGDELYLEPKKMSVTVDMPDGSRAEIEITPSDTSADIKQKVEAKTGMSVPRQVLKKDGSELPEGTTVKDMGVRDGDNLSVDVFTVPVTVNTMDGQVIKIDVDPTDKLGDMKKQLESESGIPWNNQQLFKDGSVLADDDKTAQDHGIQGGDELYLEPKKMSVTVDMPDGSRAEIEITPSDTSADIKQKIEAKTGMSVPRQVLKKAGIELPQGKSAKAMGIRDGDTLGVDVFTVPVTVRTMDGKEIKIDVDPADKLGDVKKQLEPESGIPVSNQRLYKAGQELVDDGVTAGQHGIQAGDVLDLEPKSMTVQVEMPDGTTCDVDITPADMDVDIKRKIQEKTGMEVPRQVLKHNEKELPKRMTAKEMGLDEGSKLKVGIFKVPIAVDTMDGEKHRVMIDPTEKLGDIKKQLEAEIGLPADNNRLYMNGTELADDAKTAQDYGIKAGSELSAEPKQIRVSVRLPDGSVITLFVKPSDKAADIKAKVEDTTGLAVHRQLLKQHLPNKEWLLPLHSTVRDLGIKEGAELFVDIYKIPIVVQTKDGEKKYHLEIEPSGPVDVVRYMLQAQTGTDAQKIVLYFNEEEMRDLKLSAEKYGVKAHSLLVMDTVLDAIIFVDIKCGTLFAMDRDEVIAKNGLTPNQGNKLDFLEAARDSMSRDKILKALKESPKLGFAPQVVVEKQEVEDYDVAEAEAVKNKWGVSLKKREKNKKGEELLFIDAKTGAAGELSRQKYVSNGFITLVDTPKGASLAEAETDTMMYDRYIQEMRAVFGVRSAK